MRAGNKKAAKRPLRKIIMDKESKKWGYYIIALIPPLMGGVSYVISRYVIHDISPITLVFYRFLGALILLTPFAIRPFLKEITSIHANIRILFIMGISGVTLFNMFVYYAVHYTTSTNVSIIVSIFPVFVIGLGVVISKDKLEKTQIFSILFSFLGVLIILSQGQIFKGISTLFSNIGDFIALGAAICWAIYIFATKFKPKDMSFMSLSYAPMLIGTILILPAYLFDIYYLKNTFTINLQTLSVIFCLGLGVSIIGMMTLNVSVVKIGPNLSSILYYTAPLFTAIMAVMILNERFEFFHFIGMIIILFGINIPLLVRFLPKKKLEADLEVLSNEL